MTMLQHGMVGSEAAGYSIGHSVRFRKSASAYLSASAISVNSPTLWTRSFWIKRGEISAASTYSLFCEGTAVAERSVIRFDANGALQVFHYSGSTFIWNKVTTTLFSDPSSHYHVVISYNSANATAEDRVKIYINGTRITSFSTNVNPALNGSSYFNNTASSIRRIGYDILSGPYFDGYMAEIHSITGQELTAADFGEFSTTTGDWVPKAYSGTYGSSGFYLPFSDATSLTTLSADASGNGNNWTCNNISLTAGSTYDWMLDVPGNSYATLDTLYTGKSTLTNGNLTASGSSDLPTILPSSSYGITWYFERGGVSQTWTPPAAFPAGTGDYNFGQRPWQSTGPTGTQKALCQANLPSSGTVIVSGSFTGNANANGPRVDMNGVPKTLTINGNAVTFGTHADKLANGFKLRTSSASYNASGTNTWTATIDSDTQNIFKYNNAEVNP